ncbi:(2Fe-2S)-binding protein [Sinorhizobium meliloti]|uniref:(2Fe-2S)-binding protein n=1 Tax=Rhizobium meliloti TaxID=382 RepID=UPI000FDA37D8|nr:(2Fe-2S)-binding protein [Sinorhizobium meliloti]MDW9359372.1 (2Fe-2S)-binding protein [Sinorhizobium meliloti]MDW9527539.1 (2Fe-2S)-binding protein [Sinorhizobium meliloti]MDW9658586.1 (2Fe-2S)-binding protein [Sinorhizobium meliloti]MDW9881239.1 (2Fe-2S)-binding protein [Sinorhizobium meliloti]MDW9918534.1 (2Fe-2S)-binding protein [Sinorhizobium meliloti]
MRPPYDLPGPSLKVSFKFEDEAIEACEGETVATALLASGVMITGIRTSGRTRGPYCLIGVCHECLVEIDGLANQRACITTVRQHMKVRRQTGLRRLTEEDGSREP